jgi:hypothetical protein
VAPPKKERPVLRKTVFLHPDEWEAVRERAYRERRTESSVVRQAIRRFLKLED